MSDNESHEYEAKVWQEEDGWVAKLLRHGCYFDSKSRLDSREEGLEWAREQAKRARAADAAEAAAERVPV